MPGVVVVRGTVYSYMYMVCLEWWSYEVLCIVICICCVVVVVCVCVCVCVAGCALSGGRARSCIIIYMCCV